jgi:hypothetical protein
MIGTVQSSILYYKRLFSVRACDAWKARGPQVPRSAVARDGYRGPARAEKKMYAGDGATRADKKAGKKYFGGSEGAGEKKNNFWAGAKKKILASMRTQPNTTHKKTYVQ